MTKIPCPSCDRPIQPHVACRDCSTLAKFEALSPPDFYGRGDLGYDGYAVGDGDKRTAASPCPRFLCFHDLEVITIDEVDAAGRDLSGEDENGIWFGTRDAPCIVPGGNGTMLILHGHRAAESWTGYYLGDERHARAAVPEGVRIEFVEEVNVNPIERYLEFR